MNTKREAMLQEALSLIQSANDDQICFLMQLLTLGKKSPGFKAAFDKAKPPGEEIPPVDVIKALVTEWAEREGLE